MARKFLPEVILNRPLRQFPALWQNFFDDDGFFPAEELSTKGARIYEENNHLCVEVPLPGLNLKDIDVSLNKGILYIKGECKEEEKNKKRRFYRSSTRKYAYSITLPAQINEKQEPNAIYKDGILTISLQLAKQGETKKIAVKAGGNKINSK